MAWETDPAHHFQMCNLYSITKSQQAIREAFRAMTDRTGNLPSMPGVFPDYPAPIVRNGPDGRELATARWGLPSPKFALEGKKMDKGVTNAPARTVRQLAKHWQVSASHVYALIGQRKLGHMRIGTLIRIRQEDVDAYEAQTFHEPTPPPPPVVTYHPATVPASRSSPGFLAGLASRRRRGDDV